MTIVDKCVKNLLKCCESTVDEQNIHKMGKKSCGFINKRNSLEKKGHPVVYLWRKLHYPESYPQLINNLGIT